MRSVTVQEAADLEGMYTLPGTIEEIVAIALLTDGCCLESLRCLASTMDCKLRIRKQEAGPQVPPTRNSESKGPLIISPSLAG